MYFEKLQRLREWGLNEVVMNQLDSWLATRRLAVTKYLNPFQFATDCSVDEALSFDAFEWSCVPEVSILERRFSVYCPHSGCGRHVKSFTDEALLDREFTCIECETEFKPSEHPDSVSIFYELLVRPASPVEPIEGAPGNVPSLRASDLPTIGEKSRSARRLLMDRFNSEEGAS